MDNIDIFELLYPTYKIKKPIRLIELFAGIGSQAKALEILKIDFQHYKVVEFDKYAIASYNAIHNTNFEQTDITKITAGDLNIIYTDQYDYILTYSFPCQDLSLAGKGKGMKKGSNTRSGLLWEVERLLDECTELPQILLMENVPQVLGSANAKDFRKWQLKLEELGYSNYVSLLNAKDFGIPQNRNRCFMVSILGQYNNTFPKSIPLKLRLKDMLEKKIDEKYYLSKTHLNNFLKHSKDVEDDICEVKQLGNCMPCKNRDNPNQGRIYSISGLSPTITSMEGGNRQPMVIEEPKILVAGRINASQDGVILDVNGICKTHTAGHNNCPKILEPVICASGGRNPDNPKSRKSGIPTEQMLEIKTDGCSNTLTTVQKDNLVLEPITRADGININASDRFQRGPLKVLSRTLKAGSADDGVILNQSKIRKLTPLECWRLMGFSDQDFYKAAQVNSNSQLYKQAGNSIVVNVLVAIFKQFLEELEK